MTRAWILASAALGLLVGLAPCSPDDFGLWPVLIFGVSLGQGLLLRESVPAWRWTLATIGGMAVGVPLGYIAAIGAFGGMAVLVRATSDPDFVPILVLAVAVGSATIGLVLGVAQGKLAAGDGRVRPWALASAGGVMAASPLFLAVTCSDVLTLAGLPFSRPLLTTLCGLGYGLVTAFALPSLFARGLPVERGSRPWWAW